MVDPVVVRRKLVKMGQYLDELAPLQEYSFEEYEKNHYIRRTAERLIQLLVDVAADINTHILVDAGEPPPADYRESFLRLSRLGVLPEAFAAAIAPSVGERNIIVHEYEAIDDRKVYDSIPLAMKQYRQYVGYVEAYLTHADGRSGEN